MAEVEVMELPVLAPGFAFACRVNGAHRHRTIVGVKLLSFFCNCTECCRRRVLIDCYPPELLGMIAVRLVPTDRGARA